VRRAWVFFDRIKEAAAVQGRSAGWVLGYVIAHEIAHMLGELGHMDRGIMERSLDLNGHLTEGFTPEQGDRIHATLRLAERGVGTMTRWR
jgi:hypothetical protein